MQIGRSENGIVFYGFEKDGVNEVHEFEYTALVKNIKTDLLTITDPTVVDTVTCDTIIAYADVVIGNSTVRKIQASIPVKIVLMNSRFEDIHAEEGDVTLVNCQCYGELKTKECLQIWPSSIDGIVVSKANNLEGIDIPERLTNIRQLIIRDNSIVKNGIRFHNRMKNCEVILEKGSTVEGELMNCTLHEVEDVSPYLSSLNDTPFSPRNLEESPNPTNGRLDSLFGWFRALGRWLSSFAYSR